MKKYIYLGTLSACILNLVSCNAEKNHQNMKKRNMCSILESLMEVSKDQIVKSIENSPLIIKGSTNISDSIVNELKDKENKEKKRLYFGTGLCTTKSISYGLPFDFLSMLIEAERLRILLNYDEIIHLIADSHAKTIEAYNKEDIDLLAKEELEIINKACIQLGLEKTYLVKLASEFDKTNEYNDIYNSINKLEENEYVKKEWTDIEYMRRNFGVSLKLSWKIGSKQGKYDESFVDTGYCKEFKTNMSFVYCVPGRTFDPQRQNVCPYTTIPGEKRIILKKEENALEKTTIFMKENEKVAKASTRYLDSIVEEFELIFGDQYTKGELSKLDAIIQKVFFY